MRTWSLRFSLAAPGPFAALTCYSRARIIGNSSPRLADLFFLDRKSVV